MLNVLRIMINISIARDMYKGYCHFQTSYFGIYCSRCNIPCEKTCFFFKSAVMTLFYTVGFNDIPQNPLRASCRYILKWI